MTVLITGGEFTRKEGVCLGAAPYAGGLWSVPPESFNRILNLTFDEEFGALINRGRDPGKK